jgi:hypothetical protein
VWVLLSSRIRTWLMLAVAVPVLRSVLRRASASASRRDPSSTAARALRSADAGLSRLDRRTDGSGGSSVSAELGRRLSLSAAQLRPVRD